MTHLFLIPFTPLLGLSHFLSSVTPSLWQSCIPYYVPQLSHFTDSFYPSQMALTLTSQPSYYMYIFHTYLTTSQLSNNSHTSPSNFHTSHTLIIPTPLQLPKHIPHDSHCPITVTSLRQLSHLHENCKLSDNCYTSLAAITAS